MSTSNLLTPIKLQKNKKYTTFSHLNTFSRDIELLARVTDKTELKEYKNEKGIGHIFNINVIDQEGTEMQVACFNKVANKFHSIIKENSVYEIIGGFVKVNNKKFNPTNFEYQLILNDSTVIREILDDGLIPIPQAKLNLKKLGELESLQMHSNIDCLGYVVEATDRSVVNTRNGEMAIRKVHIVDDSEYKVEVALWKKNADLVIEIGDIILIKNAAVSEFHGRNISASDNTRITINPSNIKEAMTLSKWHANFNGIYKTYNPQVQKEVIESNEEINKEKIERIGEIINKYENFTFKNGRKDDFSAYYTIKGTVSYLQHSEKNIYAGCPVKKCKKKLLQEENSYLCTSCKLNVKVPAYYMTLSIRIRDASTEHWVDLYGSVAETFLGLSAEEYRELIVNNNRIQLNEISKKIEFQLFYFLIRIKITLFNNILKKKINVYKSEKIDYVAESERLLKALELTFGLVDYNTFNSNKIESNNNFNLNNINDDDEDTKEKMNEIASLMEKENEIDDTLNHDNRLEKTSIAG